MSHVSILTVELPGRPLLPLKSGSTRTAVELSAQIDCFSRGIVTCSYKKVRRKPTAFRGGSVNPHWNQVHPELVKTFHKLRSNINTINTIY